MPVHILTDDEIRKSHGRESVAFSRLITRQKGQDDTMTTLQPLTPDEFRELSEDLEPEQLTELLDDREKDLSDEAEEMFFLALEDGEELIVHDPYGNELDFEGWRGFYIFKAR